MQFCMYINSKYKVEQDLNKRNTDLKKKKKKKTICWSFILFPFFGRDFIVTSCVSLLWCLLLLYNIFFCFVFVPFFFVLFVWCRVRVYSHSVSNKKKMDNLSIANLNFVFVIRHTHTFECLHANIYTIFFIFIFLC